MPIFEFRCESCSQVFEHLAMSSGDEIAAVCPHCGGEELSRVMSTCASLIDAKAPAKGSPGGPSFKQRTCEGSGSCTEMVLPGYGD